MLTAVAETVAVDCSMCSLIAISALAKPPFRLFPREREHVLASAREARSPRIVLQVSGSPEAKRLSAAYTPSVAHGFDDSICQLLRSHLPLPRKLKPASSLLLRAKGDAAPSVGAG